MTQTHTRNGTSTLGRRVRAITGLYLLAYVTSHLLNLSLGLISINAMDAARPYLTGVWSGPVTRWVLLLALIAHYGAGLRSIYLRPRISGTLQDLVQALSGLAVIPLLSIHVIGVVMLDQYGVDVEYDLLLRVFWLSNPEYGLVQVLLLSVAWIHGGAGLFMWLRATPRAVRVLPWLYPLGVAVPILALLGFTEAGRVVLASRAGPVLVQSGFGAGEPVPEIPFLLIIEMQRMLMWSSIAVGLAVLVTRGIRRWRAKPEMIRLTTKDVGTFDGETGQMLLDALRAQNQPHANLCSGRGRCGTCAVHILAAQTDLPPPNPLEQATLDKRGFGPDVRLACQLLLISGGALKIQRVFVPDVSFDAPDANPATPVSAEVEA